jgi:hypothetical protein
MYVRKAVQAGRIATAHAQSSQIGTPAAPLMEIVSRTSWSPKRPKYSLRATDDASAM